MTRNPHAPLQILLAAACLLATGCKPTPATQNSETYDSNTAKPHPVAVHTAADSTPPPTDTRPVIVCLGDSLTAGYGADPGQSYPDFLQRDLDAAGYHYHVVNQGISGDTTKDALARVDEAIVLHPTVTIVELGGNDGLRGLRPEDTRATLDAILARLQPTGTKIVLAGITLPPDYGPDYIKQFTAMYTTLAKKYRVPLLPFLLKDVYGVPGSMQADKTHATAQGNQQVAKNLLPYVQPLLKK